MFYIHDFDGVRFQGPLEKLVQWGNVNRKQNVRSLRDNEQSPDFRTGSDTRAIADYQKQLSRHESMVEPLIHAHQIMSSPVLTVQLTTLLVDAHTLLQQESIKQLVVTNDQRRVLGMLSERNILERINIIDNVVQDIHNIPVGEIIDRKVISSHSISDIRRIAKVLAKFHIDALPVIEDDVLIGIVTRGDILRGFAENPKLNLYA
jgi:CBS domain-containing protein